MRERIQRSLPIAALLSALTLLSLAGCFRGREEAREEPKAEDETAAVAPGATAEPSEDQYRYEVEEVKRGQAELQPREEVVVEGEVAEAPEAAPAPRREATPSQEDEAAADRARERRLAAREAEIAQRERDIAARERAARRPTPAPAPRAEPEPEPEEVAEAPFDPESDPEPEPEINDIDVEMEEEEPERERPPLRRADPATVAAGTVMPVEFMEGLSSATSAAGDTFRVRVANDVEDEEGRVVIPAGSEVQGMVEQAVAVRGRVGGQAKLDLRFTDLVLPTGETVPIDATFVGQARSETKKDAATIGGGAAGGAVLGRVLGGKHKGRATIIGAILGAAAGTAIASRTPGEEVEIPAGTAIQLRLDDTVEIGGGRR
jgi:type IV secretory pathway VirB10-like protein